jgi:dTDP-4-dehydrorhamnose reductase
MKVLVTGGFGLVGSRLLDIWGGKYEIVVVDTVDHSQDFPQVKYQQVDITDGTRVMGLLEQEKPDYVVHTAAYTNVEKAESDRETAWKLNVEASLNLAEAAEKHKTRFIYLSTGFVFEGRKEKYAEDDTEAPVNYYALTKLEGERGVRKLLPETVVIRLTFPYRTQWSEKSDTIRWLVETLKKGEKVSLVKDQHISPTFIDDLAVVIEKVIDRKATGVFHAAPKDCLSFYEIGEKVCSEFGFDKKLLKSTTLDEFLVASERQAVQPRYNCLVSNRLTELGVTMTSLDEGLKKVKESYS